MTKLVKIDSSIVRIEIGQLSNVRRRVQLWIERGVRLRELARVSKMKRRNKHHFIPPSQPSRHPASLQPLYLPQISVLAPPRRPARSPLDLGLAGGTLRRDTSL